MSKTILWLLALGGAAAAVYYFVKGQAAAPASSGAFATQTPTTNTTGTATTPAMQFAGWGGFTQTALQSGTSAVNNAFASLTSLSSVFGGVAGGNGVQISGSATGSVNSSGGGTGVLNSAVDLFSGNDF